MQLLLKRVVKILELGFFLIFFLFKCLFSLFELGSSLFELDPQCSGILFMLSFDLLLKLLDLRLTLHFYLLNG